MSCRSFGVMPALRFGISSFSLRALSTALRIFEFNKFIGGEPCEVWSVATAARYLAIEENSMQENICATWRAIVFREAGIELSWNSSQNFWNAFHCPLRVRSEAAETTFLCMSFSEDSRFHSRVTETRNYVVPREVRFADKLAKIRGNQNAT